MADDESGLRSPTRFFSFRWLYLLLACLLWSFLVPLCFFEVDTEYWWSPTFLLLNLISELGVEAYAMGMHGVLGFNLFEDWWNPRNYVIDPFLAAPLMLTTLMVLTIAAFVIPESGRAKNLPATRGVHARAKLAASIMLGLALTALLAGILDVANVDLKPTFQEIGWLASGHGRYGWGSYSVLSYYPDTGIVKPVSWISAAGCTATFGALCWLALSFIKPGRDRYWQAERWTLMMTLFGLLLTGFGLFGMGNTTGSYADLDQFLGGCYSTFVLGCVMLTWAWTCRALMFMMLMRYEKATFDPENPVCFACGYSLRGLASSSCPECGTQVKAKLIESKKPADRAGDQAESRSTTR